MKITIISKTISCLITFSIGNIPGGIVSLVFLLAQCLFYWLIRHRVAYICTILTTSLAALKFEMCVFTIAVGALLLQAVWCVLCAGAYYKLTADTELSYGSVALLYLGTLWGLEVLNNTLHVVVCSVIRDWFVGSRGKGITDPLVPDEGPAGTGTGGDAQSETRQKKKPRRFITCPGIRGLCRALTIHFGAICFGSLIMAGLGTTGSRMCMCGLGSMCGQG